MNNGEKKNNNNNDLENESIDIVKNLFEQYKNSPNSKISYYHIW